MRINLNQAGQALREIDRPRDLGLTSDEVITSSGSAPGEGPAPLSVARVQIQVLVAQVSQLSETRQEKVTALRQVILGAVYQPTSDQLAEAVFAHMLANPAA